MHLSINTPYVRILLAAALLQVWYVPKAVAISASGDNVIDDWVRLNGDDSLDPMVSSRAALMRTLARDQDSSGSQGSEQNSEALFDQLLGKLVSEVTLTVAVVTPLVEISLDASYFQALSAPHDRRIGSVAWTDIEPHAVIVASRPTVRGP